MPRNISKPFNMTLSLIDIEPLKPKYKCFFGEDVQLNITVTDENRQPLDLSQMSARVYYICDGVDLRQDDNITITDTMRGRLNVIVKRNYIRVGTNDVRVVLYDDDQEIMLQPATILCKATDISDVNPPPEDPAFDYKTEILKVKNTSINNQTHIGDISTLKTTVKSDLVAGINELKDSIKTNTSQLEQKANIQEVFFKNNGININDFDEDTRKTFLNAQGINVNYVLGEGNVKEINTSFLLPSKNLFNITKSTINKYVYSGSGALGDNELYDTTEFIEVKPNTSYSHNFSNGNYVFYDVNKSFISGGTSLTNVFTTPSNCYYIRKSYKKDGMKSMLVEGNIIPSSYIPYEFSLDEKIQIKAQSITDECRNDIYSNIVIGAKNTDFINISPNLINPSNITLNKYVYSANGGLGDNENYDVTEFIEVKSGVEYSTNCTVGNYAYYNSEKVFVSGGISLNSLFTIPTNVKYLRKSIHKNVSDRFISESSKSIKYVPYGEKKLSETIKVLNTQNSKWLNKKWYVIGDSITYANTYMKGYAKVASEILGCDITIDAISGQTLSTMCDRVTSESIGDKDLITVMCCMNDYKNTEIGTIEDKTNTTFYGNLYLTIKKILEIKPSIKIAFITSQRGGNNEYFPPYDSANSKGYKQIDYVNAVKKMCEKYAIPILDLYSVSGINEFTFTTYTDDNIHPNEKGHKLIGEIISSFLNMI